MKQKIANALLLSAALIAVFSLISSCAKKSVPEEQSLPPTVTLLPSIAEGKSTLSLPTPNVRITAVPDVEAAVRAYLNAWRNDDYETMYAMLTQVSRDALSYDTFYGRYVNIANELSLENINYEILSSLVNPRSAQVAYNLHLSGVLIKDIQRTTTMKLSLEDGGWRIQWDEALMLPELAGGNKLWMDYKVPARGNIFDREGDVLASQADAVALGIEANKVGPDYMYDILQSAWNALGQRPDLEPNLMLPTLQKYYQNGWYLGLGEVRTNANYRGFISFDGAVAVEFSGRYYDLGGVGQHAVGYISSIQAEEADRYRRKGYRIDQKVGRSGIELWGEDYLAGKRGGTLYVANPEGKVVTKIASVEPSASASIYTTFLKDYQLKAQRTLNGFRGALVVMERDSGRILAMASSPGFDPNAFEPTNYNSTFLLNKIYQDTYTPLMNRATMGQYPLGSVFKIITMAAALESGLYTPETQYDCGYFFEELPGLKLSDWTWEHVQRGEDISPSGVLTLPEGLMRSCNPFFWHIGLDLFRQGHTKDISNMARGFGLGKKTGIIGISPSEEETGNITDPATEVDAVNNAIGQGQTLVTPLQVASFVAAVGNGGTLYKPQMIEKVEASDGEILYEFKPEAVGKLPVKYENLQVIQEAMKDVVRNRRGTAWRSFMSTMPVAGKTGTAQDPPNKSHAWFAGYTYANDPKKPDIAAAVIVENQGEGSEYAAPIFRALVDLYFKGGRNPFVWEVSIGVLPTPTSPVPTEPQQ